VFDYQLTEGPSTAENAVALLEIHGAPRAMIVRARALVEQFRTR
jgi:DNA mismatch repair ATPase MutS